VVTVCGGASVVDFDDIRALWTMLSTPSSDLPEISATIRHRSENSAAQGRINFSTR
jgi:hypothetical protein